MNDGDIYKALEDKTRLFVDEPIIARLDGKNFHAYTRHMKRPYDKRLSDTMVTVAEYLAKETSALAAYTQSDEISLTWYPRDRTEAIFGGKVQKMASLLASMCAVRFNMAIPWQGGDANFDCRVFNVGTPKMGGGYFAWRIKDASKNAISMAASSLYSEKQLHGKTTRERLQMIKDAGVNYVEYPEFFRTGTFIKQVKETRKFTAYEMAMLPPKHEAHLNPHLMVERIDYIRMGLPDRVLSEWIYGN